MQASDRRLRTNKVLVGNGLELTQSTEVAADATVDQNAYLYHVTASVGAVTLTMPTTPRDHEEHCFVRVAGANDITLDGNGKSINGAAQQVMGVADRVLTLRYDATADQWLER